MCLSSLLSITTSARKRKWPLAIAVIVAVTGMAYSLLWPPVVRHDVVRYSSHPLFHTALSRYLERIHPVAHYWYWVTPGDIWGTLRASQTIGWGYLGGIYSAHGAFLLPPGMLFILLPIDKAIAVFHLHPSYPLPLFRPSAWVILGPYEMLLSAVALCGIDALSEHIGISSKRRALLCVAEAVALWQVVVIWGHPEDLVALGLGCYAIVAAMDGRPVATGWLMGAALSVQPFTVLILPVVLAINAVKKMPSVLVRALSVPAVLVAVPAISDFHATWRALVVQPTYPRTDHPTPWLFLAPKLGNHAVSGGPTRIFAVIAAIVIGLVLFRMVHRGKKIERILPVACALSFTGWCMFESVMTPYYLWPALAFALLAAACLGRIRLGIVLGVGMFATVFAFHYYGPWLWWGTVTGSLLLACAVGIPYYSNSRSPGIDEAQKTTPELPAVAVS